MPLQEHQLMFRPRRLESEVQFHSNPWPSVQPNPTYPLPRSTVLRGRDH